MCDFAIYALGMRLYEALPRRDAAPLRAGWLGVAGVATALVAAVITFSAPGGAAAQGWKATWEETLAAARKEGEVTVYCTPSAGHRNGLAGFQKAYPDIKLNLVPMGVPQLEARVNRERKAGIYGFDVYVAGISSSVFTRQIPAGWYEPLRSAVILPGVLDDSKWRVGPVGPGVTGFDAGFLDQPRKFAYAFSWNVSKSVYINYNHLPKGLIKDVRDFLKPELKGKIAWLDPRMRQSGSAVLADMMQTLSDADVKRLLVEQQPVITRNGRQIAEWVAQGRYPVGIGINASDILPFTKVKGVGENIVNYTLFTASPTTGGLMYFNRAPHPNAAKIFINWLLSREGQDYWAKSAKRVSRRNDVPSYDPDPGAVPDPDFKYFSANVWQTATARGKAMKLAEQLLGN